MDLKLNVKEKFKASKIHTLTTFDQQPLSEFYATRTTNGVEHISKNLNSVSLSSTKVDDKSSVSHVAKLRQQLKNSSLKFRQKWSEQLLLKLVLLQQCFRDKFVILTLESIYINDKCNLTMDLENLEFGSMDTLNLYLAPENINKNNEDYSIHQAVWSAGICLYYINALSFPWLKASVEDKNYLSWLQNKKFSFRFNSFVQRTLKFLLNPNKKISLLARNWMPNIFVDNLNHEVVSKCSTFVFLILIINIFFNQKKLNKAK